jgi:hypothetical protein
LNERQLEADAIGGGGRRSQAHPRPRRGLAGLDAGIGEKTGFDEERGGVLDGLDDLRAFEIEETQAFDARRAVGRVADVEGQERVAPPAGIDDDRRLGPDFELELWIPGPSEAGDRKSGRDGGRRENEPHVRTLTSS